MMDNWFPAETWFSGGSVRFWATWCAALAVLTVVGTGLVCYLVR